MWFAQHQADNLHENSLIAIAIIDMEIHQFMHHPFTKSAHLSHLDCDPQQLQRGECMTHFLWKVLFCFVFAALCQCYFTDLQQMQASDSRRDSISINGVWGWGKTCSFVTWEFWGVPLPQDQYCLYHKHLCHPAFLSTKTHIIFLPFRSPFCSSQKLLQKPIKANS